MQLKEIQQWLESLAPLSLQEDYDNSGLQVGDPSAEVGGILLCLDLTDAVMDEALERRCNLIISHHPLIFKGLKRITGLTSTERLVSRAVKEDLILYALHTNFDSISRGVSQALADKLGLLRQRILAPRRGLLRKLVTFVPKAHADEVREALFQAGAGHIGNYSSCSFNAEGLGSFRAESGSRPFVGEAGRLHLEEEIRIETVFPTFREGRVLSALLGSHPYEEVAYDIYPLDNEWKEAGFGILGELPEAMPEADFLPFVKDRLALQMLRHSPPTGREVVNVALCGGAGSFLIGDALRSGAQVYLTGDLKYHDFFLGEERLLLADIGHHESERWAVERMHALIQEKFPNFASFISGVDTNPIHYI